MPFFFMPHMQPNVPPPEPEDPERCVMFVADPDDQLCMYCAKAEDEHDERARFGPWKK